METFSYMPIPFYKGSFSFTNFLLVYVGSFLHALCWFHSLGSFSYTVYAGFFMWGISSLQNKRTTTTSKCHLQLVKVNKKLHNWVILLFKAEGDVTYRLQKVTAWLPAESAGKDTNLSNNKQEKTEENKLNEQYNQNMIYSLMPKNLQTV